MTDKQLDEKLQNAFDKVRADGSVKARIRKGLTGDSMERKKITVTNTENITKNERTEKREKATVRRRGRVAAAAAAAVMLVGGGGYLLKSGFDNVEEPMTTDGSAEQLTGSVPDDFVGWFDPEGYTVFDKFGPESDIWRLNDGRFLVMQHGNLNGEDDEFYKGLDGMEYYCFVYDGIQNSVVGSELTSKDWRIQVYDDCFALWDVDHGEPNEWGFSNSTACTGNIYDFDMNPIKSDISIEADGQIIGLPMLTPDKDIYYTVSSYSDDGCTITVYDENGEHFTPAERADHAVASGMSRDGSFIYTTFRENDDITICLDMPNGERGMSISVEGEGYPMIFDIGRDIYYFTMEEPSSQTELYKYNAAESDQSELFTLDTAAGKSGGYYVSEGGRFLFVCTNDYGAANSSTVRVYDTTNGFEMIHEEIVPGLNLNFDEFGANVLVDEAGGDVCIGGFFDGKTDPSPRKKTSITFNLYGVDYGNFGIGVYQDDPEPDDGETAVWVSGEETELYCGFDPAGETLFDKFGGYPEIWKITDDRYVVETLIEESKSYEYAVYDVPTNTVVNKIVSKTENGIDILDNGFVTYIDPQKDRTSTTISATVYDLDGVEVLHYGFDTRSTSPTANGGISDVAFSHDGTAMYLAVEEKKGMDSHTTRIYRGTPDEFSVVYGYINGYGWDDIIIMDMAVSQDGSTLAYDYIAADGKSMKAGLIDTGSYRIDETDAQRVSYIDFADLGWDGHHYLFERGNNFYFINDESGKIVCAEAVYGGYTSAAYTVPYKGSYDYYMSETGRYILLTSTDTDDSHIYIYEIADDGLTQANDLNMGKGSKLIYSDGMNTFFDENTGDLCLQEFSDGMSGVYMTNVFGSEYGNFGWNTTVSREGDYPQEATATTVTADIPEIATDTSDSSYGYKANIDMTLTIEGDMVYIVSDPEVIKEVKQWYKDFLAANYEPAQYPDSYTELAYEPRSIRFYDDDGNSVVIETPENTVFDVRVNGVDYNNVEMEVISRLWWDTYPSNE